jgi:hypothetical protein
MKSAKTVVIAKGILGSREGTERKIGDRTERGWEILGKDRRSRGPERR